MNRNIIILLIIVTVLWVAGYFYLAPRTSQDTSRITSTDTLVSPLLKTEAWLGLVTEYPGGIALRTISDTSETLLLKHNNADMVYSYNPNDRQLQLTNREAWTNAAGIAVDCNLQVGKEPRRIHIDRETNKLLVDDKEVKGIRGRVHLRYQFTSNGDKFAVLSASGEKASSLLPFLGEGGASGTHYNQVFSFPGLAPIGSAVELPFTTEKTNVKSCWSSDERYVVYSDVIDSEMSIVTVR